MRERRRDYELMLVLSPLSADEEGIAATLDRIGQTITSEGGEITETNHSPPWGRRKLAYPIREYVSGEASRRSFSDGYYVLVHFTLAAAKVAELERTIKLTEAVLRYLITLVERKTRANGGEASVADEEDRDEADANDMDEEDEDEGANGDEGAEDKED